MGTLVLASRDALRAASIDICVIEDINVVEEERREVGKEEKTG